MDQRVSLIHQLQELELKMVARDDLQKLDQVRLVYHKNGVTGFDH